MIQYSRDMIGVYVAWRVNKGYIGHETRGYGHCDRAGGLDVFRVFVKSDNDQNDHNEKPAGNEMLWLVHIIFRFTGE